MAGTALSGAAPEFTPSFVAPPLRDASKQIRLLRLFVAGEPGPLDHWGVPIPHSALLCSTSVCDLDSAPEYVAISYTWGPPTPTALVWLDGWVVVVRENCHAALRQCVNSGIDTYVWIDAICIDQTDNAEKSRQVAMMSSIFGHAERVLVYLGPLGTRDVQSANNVLELAKSLLPSDTTQEAEDMQEGLPARKGPYGVSEESFVAGGSELSPAMLHNYWTFYEAFQQMRDKKYWTRIWVLQELMMAKTVELLYIDATIDMRLIWDATQRLDLYKFDDTITQASIYRVLRMLYPGSEESFGSSVVPTQRTMSLTLVLKTFGHLGCADRRDCVYGTMSFISWPGGVSPLEPDYSKSAIELAVDLMRYLPSNTFVKDALMILNTLKISALQLTQLSRPAEVTAETGTVGMSQPNADEHVTVWPRTHDWCFLLSPEQTETGQPQAQTETVTEDSPLARRTCAACRPGVLEPAAAPDLGKLVTRNGYTVAAVCKATQPGDILLRGECSNFGMVVRQLDHEHSVFSIVGHAFIAGDLHGTLLCPHESMYSHNGKSPCHALDMSVLFTITLDPYEFFRFIRGQADNTWAASVGCETKQLRAVNDGFLRPNGLSRARCFVAHDARYGSSAPLASGDTLRQISCRCGTLRQTGH